MTELHNRLNQIVECSSQLIFVTADTASRQQKALTEFLSNQTDNTDVSFFKADEQGNSDVNRLSIYSQITGNYFDTDINTLPQMLDLEKQPNSSGGLFLVCISQAERLQSEFLKELWNWTLKAQKYGNNTRLSVLLFCESSWAQRAFKSLSVDDDICPILISEDVQDAVGFDVNALESLMNDKNSWLSINNRPLVTNKWFLTSIATIFLVAFASLMSLRYSNEQQNDLILVKNTPSKSKERLISNNFKIEESELGDDSINQNTSALFALNFNGVQTTDVKHSEILNETVDVNKTLLGLVDIANEFNTEMSSASLESNGVIVAWSEINIGEQVSTLAQHPRKIEEENINEVDPPSYPLPQSMSQTIVDLENSSDAIDFKVKDIISVEQLSVVLADDENKYTQQQVAAIYDNKTNIDYRFDETTLLSLPTNAVVLQLSGIQNPVVLENYLKNNNLKTSTWVYETQRYGGPWYVVIYNQVFDSIESAVNNVPRLPDVIKESQPFAKNINQIKKEIRTR